MSIQWADDFSRYGSNPVSSPLFMVEGTPWVNVGRFNSQGGSIGSRVITDPDPNESGLCLFVNVGTGSGNNTGDSRLALSTPVSKIGVAFRAYIQSFAGTLADCPMLCNLKTVNNNHIYTLNSTPNGGIQVRSNVLDSTAVTNSVVVAEVISPVLTPSAWHHLEFVVERDNINGDTVQVIVNGRLRINHVTEPYPDQQSVGLVGFRGSFWPGSSLSFYLKDLVVWDGLGSRNNNVMGTVSVKRYAPVEDVTLGGWVLNGGDNGHQILNNTLPTNILTSSAQFDSDGTENIQTAGVYYRPVTGAVDVGTPAGTSANPWRFALGATLADSIVNFANAVNGTGTPGVTYSTGLVANPNVKAVGFDGTRVCVQSRDGLTVSYPFNETMANSEWAQTTMAINRGPLDLVYLAADDTPPDQMEFSFDSLPDDVTSVRGIITTVRARKVDGGDATIQTGLSSNDVDWDNGEDRPITTAFTYWSDISEISPETSDPWTPLEFDTIKVKVDRTS